MNSMVDIWVDEVVHVTEEAVLLLIDEQKCWVPRSQIEDGESVETGYSGQLFISERKAEELELV